MSVEAFYLTNLIAELEAETHGTHQDTDALPASLPLTAIHTLEAVFQVREVNPLHVEDIARALRDGATVPPLVILRVGKRAVVVDGHHRLEAHRKAGVTHVPVVAFKGTVREAVLEACAANSITKQPMTLSERQDAAWCYVLLGQHTKPQLAKAANCSERTIGNMRAVKVRLGQEAYRAATWSEAMRMDRSAGRNDHSEEERAEWMEATAQRYADRMTKALGSDLTANPEIAARALAIHFGRRLEPTWRHLKDYLPDALEGDY